jgi:phosphotransferase system  glucose/maltose/N-acetylglucosamine-specific IIC component
MSADYAHARVGQAEREPVARAAVATRMHVVLSIGPATALAGIAWALLQPWRLTLLHPFGQGFWWLFAEPPLYVVLVGVLFRLLIAPGLVQDIEEAS